MKIKPLTLINIILASVLLTSIVFSRVTTTSSIPENEPPEYDPFHDVTSDGFIGIDDITEVAELFGAEGTPINWTKLLGDIDNLKDRVEALENQTLPQGFINKPAWDSKWTSIGTGDTKIYHNLNTTDVIVCMLGKDSYGNVHQKDYGGYRYPLGSWYGAYWYNLDNESITVHRHGDDGDWIQVRIMIWKIPPT